MNLTTNLCSAVPKVWSRFLFKKRDGTFVKLRIVDLPKDRVDDFIDFIMNFYVKYEITHQIASIPKSKAAMEEYREIFVNRFQKCVFVVCFEDNENAKPEIVAFSGIKLLKRGESDEDNVQPTTKEMKRYFQILRDWNSLYPVPDIMQKHDLESFYDDFGVAVHPNYLGGGIAVQLTLSRRKMCTAHGVPLTGAWLTNLGSWKAANRAGCKTVYDVSIADLSKKLGVTFDNPKTISKYAIATPL